MRKSQEAFTTKLLLVILFTAAILTGKAASRNDGTPANCAPCQGEITTLTLQYLGKATANIVIQDSKAVYFSGAVDANQLITMKDLHDKLYLSESQQEAEKVLFQKQLSIIIILTAALSFLAMVFIYFSARLKQKQQELIKANARIKSVVDSLEKIVEERTKLLQQT